MAGKTVPQQKPKPFDQLLQDAKNRYIANKASEAASEFDEITKPLLSVINVLQQQKQMLTKQVQPKTKTRRKKAGKKNA